MKTLKMGEEVRRIEEGSVKEMIKAGWKLCPKSVYKTKRDAGKKVEPKTKVVKEKVKGKQST